MKIFRKKDIALATQIKEKLFRKREPWEQNLFVLWFGTFMAGIGFSLVMPFMSLYIDTLGSYTTSQLNFWSGITFSSTFLVTTLISPWWGKLADQKGRKLMLLRASLGMAIVISLMGCVTSVYQLVALRLLQGIFSGYISNCTRRNRHSQRKKRTSIRYFGYWFCYWNFTWSSTWWNLCFCVWLSSNFLYYWDHFILRFLIKSLLCS